MARVVSTAAPSSRAGGGGKSFEGANAMRPFWPWLKVLMLVNVIFTGSGKNRIFHGKMSGNFSNQDVPLKS